MFPKSLLETNNNIPVLIRDVAEVQYGSSVRYGATTRNGNGESCQWNGNDAKRGKTVPKLWPLL